MTFVRTVHINIYLQTCVTLPLVDKNLDLFTILIPRLMIVVVVHLSFFI